MSPKTVSAYGIAIPVNVEEVSRELGKLNKFTPKDVVKTASNKASPLHKYFEWNNKKAADAYRLFQARNLVLVITQDNHGNITREYESVVIDGQRMYISMKDIQKSEDLTEQVIQAALREIIFWKSKHERYSNFFSGIFTAITDAEETYRRSREKEGFGKARKGRNAPNNTANKKANSKRNYNRGLTASR